MIIVSNITNCRVHNNGWEGAAINLKDVHGVKITI